MSETPPLARPMRGALAVLLLLVFLNISGFGVVIPLLPFFAASFDAAPWQVAMMFAGYSATQLVGELFWGPLSDRLGRRPILLITTVGAALSALGLAFAPGIWLAILARTVAGFFGGNISVIQSYIADVSPPARLASRMGYVASAFSLGFVVGPAIGGLLARSDSGAIGYRPPLLLAAGLGAVAAVGMLLFVRESRIGRQAGTWASPLAGIVASLRHPARAPMLFSIFLSFVGFSGFWAVLGLWGEARFGWTAWQVGLAVTMIGIVSTLGQALVSGALIRRLGPGGALTVTLAVAAAGFAATAVAPSEWLAMVALAVAVGGYAAAQPPGSLLISRSASADAQGAALGAAGATASLARTVGPLIGGSSFSLFGQGAPLWATTLLMPPAIWAALRASRALRAAGA